MTGRADEGQAPGGTARRPSSLRVVVVDDNPDDRAEVRRMLLRGDPRRYVFSEADGGATGVRAVLDCEGGLPDCVVLDYDLPDMNAIALLGALHGVDGLPLVCPVVVMTGSVDAELGRAVLRAGAQDYIGKSWMGPGSLTHAIDNAMERQAMSRVLAERQGELRRNADRAAYFLALADALRGLGSPSAIKSAAARVLGCHLHASRVVYAEVLSAGEVLIEQGYVDGTSQIEGVWRLRDYGQGLQRELEAGRNVVVGDVASDPMYSPEEVQDYGAIEVVANLSVPLLNDHRLVGVLSVHDKRARRWTGEEVALVEHTAERTLAAVHQAKAVAQRVRSEAQLAQLIALMPSFTAVLRGPQMVFEMANQPYYALIGRGAEILGRSLLDTLPEIADQPFLAPLDQVYRTGKTFEAKGMPVRLSRPPNVALELRYVDFSYTALRDVAGQTSGILMHGIDRTDQVRAEHAMVDADRRKDEFLATLAHELRNPLSPILSGVEILRRGATPEQTQTIVAMMGRQVTQLVHLIDDLLDVARISLGKIKLRFERLELAAIVDASVEACLPVIKARRHTLEIEPGDDSLVIIGDQTRLVQVVSNLLTNAAKYSEPGGCIHVRVVRDGDSARVSVRDNGVGIAPDVLPTLWSMFTQVRDTLDKAQGGLGIGLSLVKKLVEMHGGSVEASSPGNGMGSSFSIRLPLALALALVAGEEAPVGTAAASDVAPSGTRRVLVVDDNHDGATCLSSLLKAVGHQTAVAHDGRTALAIAHDFHPDVVLLDIGLPDIDGYEVARRLRAGPHCAGALLVAISGWGAESDRQKSGHAGFDFHLVKPVKIDAVQALLRSCRPSVGPARSWAVPIGRADVANG